MRVASLSMVILVIMASLGGCFGEEKEVVQDVNLFGSLCSDQGGTISNPTWYHFANATDAPL